MQNKISTFVASQLSERINNEYPLFVEFLKLYYQYAEARNGSLGSIQNRHLDFDIDNTLEEYVDEFYTTYGKFLPKETVLDRRSIIKLLNDLYLAKGTEKSFHLLFRVLYNEEVYLTYPGDKMLIASDGRWYQESFITVRTKYGTPQITDISEISVTNDHGVFFLKPIRIDTIAADIFRFYFVAASNNVINIGDTVSLTNTEIEYKGTVIPSPAILNIVNGGKHFSVGQIFEISGTEKNTFFMVDLVDENGMITSVDLLNFGHEHLENQKKDIYPFATAPQSSDSIVITTETSPGVFRFDLIARDTIYEFKENFEGINTTRNYFSYFMEDYNSTNDYAAITTIANSINLDSVSNNYNPITYRREVNITLEEYINSKATIQIIFGPVSKMKGRYLDDKGQISNQQICLQDNHYYQLFSYVINSGVDISNHAQVVSKLLHQAGLKYFSSIIKQENINVFANGIGFDSKQTYRIDHLDTVAVFDDIEKLVTKDSRSNILVDDIIEKSVASITNDDSTATDVFSQLFTSATVETITLTDETSKGLQPKLFDVISSGEYAASSYFNEVYTNYAGATDTIVKSQY